MINKYTKLIKYSFYILLSYAYFISTVGNMSLGISQAASDDGIIAHAISYANPQLFINDIQATTFRIETPTSLMNLIPAIAYRNLHIDPLFFWVIFLVIQTFLYPISIYGIAKIITRTKNQAVLATIILINFRPQSRNLSYSGDLDWMPYAMWLSESFFVFAIYLYLQKYRKTSFGLVILSCMIHPSLGIWTIFLFGLFDYLVTKDRKYQWKLPIFIFAIFFAFLVFNFNYIAKQSSRIVSDEYLKLMFTNTHFSSISIFTNRFDVYTIINSSIVLLVGLTIYFIFTPVTTGFISRNNFYILIKTAYFITVVGISTQIIGLLTDNIFLVRLLGTRFTSILAILSFILFLALLFDEKIESGASLFLLITFVFFPGTIIVWFYGIKKAISNWSISSFRKRILFIILVLLSFITSSRLFLSIFNSYHNISLDSLINIFGESHLFVRNFFFNFLSIELQFILYIFVILIISVIKKIKSQTYIISLIQRNNTLLIFFLTVLLLIGKMTYSSERFNSRDINFMQIQEWARFNSNPDSCYLVLVNSTYSGWRNYSRRAQISLNPTNGPYGVYIDTVLISDKVKNIVSKYPNDNLNFPSKSLLEELKSTLSLDFMVTSTASDKYDFDIVFRNQDFIVYRI